MRVRRVKPYVCVDCDFADHFRFQDTKDIDAAAGTWLRCLTYSRAQEQDGLVKASWVQRTFATTLDRIEELVRVGLLVRREDGDYELHAYAPRNQTHAMLEEERSAARARMAAARSAKAAEGMGGRSPNKRRTVAKGRPSAPVFDSEEERQTQGPSAASGLSTSRRKIAQSDRAASESFPFEALSDEEKESNVRSLADRAHPSPEHAPNAHRTSALVPTSISTSINSTSTSASSSPLLGVGGDDLPDQEDATGIVMGGAGGPSASTSRGALPASERALWGTLWLNAFTDGITDHTKRPCTAGRMYLGTLERLVTHHAPQRDAASACAWLRAEARAFAAQWEGKHPAKGFSPDGLERWLNDGRQGPPEFGRPRIVQPAAEDWHEDDWSDLGAEVMR